MTAVIFDYFKDLQSPYTRNVLNIKVPMVKQIYGDNSVYGSFGFHCKIAKENDWNFHGVPSSFENDQEQVDRLFSSNLSNVLGEFSAFTQNIHKIPITPQSHLTI